MKRLAQPAIFFGLLAAASLSVALSKFTGERTIDFRTNEYSFDQRSIAALKEHLCRAQASGVSIEPIVVVGDAEDSERDGNALAWVRASKVAAALEEIGIPRKYLFVGINRVGGLSPRLADTGNRKRVEVLFQGFRGKPVLDSCGEGFKPS
ncbi:hypothetical protein [Polaromonas aquatica]|uniref:hypothetical protein n=1 Tax=Polaromonas aquatica TaxID=332657 RepID=UPI003D65DB4C